MPSNWRDLGRERGRACGYPELFFSSGIVGNTAPSPTAPSATRLSYQLRQPERLYGLFARRARTAGHGRVLRLPSRLRIRQRTDRIGRDGPARPRATISGIADARLAAAPPRRRRQRRHRRGARDPRLANRLGRRRLASRAALRPRQRQIRRRHRSGTPLAVPRSRRFDRTSRRARPRHDDQGLAVGRGNARLGRADLDELAGSETYRHERPAASARPCDS